MKLKRIALGILILMAIGFLLRGWIYRHTVVYKSIGHRTGYSATDNKLIELIHAKADKQTSHDIEDIIKLSLSITSHQLNYTTGKCDIDPNKLVHSRKTHCVGYAKFFAVTCNFLLEKHGLAGQWTAEPQIGQIYFCGMNIHPYFKSSFFKNHDFVIIENKATGEVFAVDPTVNDYLLVDLVTFVQ